MAAFPAKAGIQELRARTVQVARVLRALTMHVASGSPPPRGTRTKVRFQKKSGRTSNPYANRSHLLGPAPVPMIISLSVSPEIE
jgi:hypothetical protein